LIQARVGLAEPNEVPILPPIGIVVTGSAGTTDIAEEKEGIAVLEIAGGEIAAVPLLLRKSDQICDLVSCISLTDFEGFTPFIRLR
jgi:hypothetical protein